MQIPATQINAATFGYEYDFATTTTTSTTVSAISEATAQALVTGNSVIYPAERMKIEFYAMRATIGVGDALRFALYDGGSSIGLIASYICNAPATLSYTTAVFITAYVTPTSGAHTYSIRAWRDSANATILAGAGGSAGASYPMTMRITKA